MEQLYCSPTLYKLHNTPEEVVDTAVTDYKRMFLDSEGLEIGDIAEDAREVENSSVLNIYFRVMRWVKSVFCSTHEPRQRTTQSRPKVRATRNFRQPKKILAVGNAGMGKTTLAKKIAHDWARGAFRTFALVLFVSMNRVNVADPIEALIIEQNPWLEGLHVSKQKLRQILETWGHKCLLILDDLSDQNEQILTAAEQALSRCNLFATTKPAAVADVGIFDTVIRIDGFSPSEATKFTCKVLENRLNVSAVMDFSNFGHDVSLFKCPLLLSFLCVLMKEEGCRDLSTMQMGEIYTKMVRCLYRKYTIRKGIEYKTADFNSTVRKLGEVAWLTLLNEKSFHLKKSHILDRVGKDAFDLGFLTVSDSFEASKPKKDVGFATWNHSSLEQYFGAVHLTQSLSQGCSVQSLLSDSSQTLPSFLTNPLFLHFFTWFTLCDQMYFHVERDVIARATFEHVMNEGQT